MIFDLLNGVLCFPKQPNAPTPAGSVNSRLSLTYLYPWSASPWLMLAALILMAATSCASLVTTKGTTMGTTQGTTKNIAHSAGIGGVQGGYSIGINSCLKPGLSCLLEEYDSMTIPGVGAPYLDCGLFLKRWLCKKCGYEKPIPKRCFRATCSECWESWATKKVKYAVARLFGYPNVYKKIKGRRVGYLADIVISPPQDYAKALVREPGGLNKLKKEAIKIMKCNGLNGYAVPHLWRVRKEVRKDLMELGADTGLKFWALIRADALNLGGFKKYAYLAPHFHILGYLQKTINGADVYEKTGGWVWIQKANISQLAKKNAKEAIKNGVPIETEEELVAKKLFYFLSHAVVREGKSAVSWFGKLSYNQMVKAEYSVITEQQTCPECGYDLVIENLETGEISPGLEKIEMWVYKRPPPTQIKLPWINEK